MPEKLIRHPGNYRKLLSYQKTEVIFEMTYYFCHTYLQKGDRTVDQMVQAARSGKQNIVEGSADGVTSMEMELKLLNVARSSIQELLEDYEDYLPAHHLTKWTAGHPRFDFMLTYCRQHNYVADYERFFERWSDEEMANVGITLCRMVDKMMMTYQKKKEDEFVTEGGIRERMTAARLGYRNNQREAITQLQHNLQTLQQENNCLKQKIKELGGE